MSFLTKMKNGIVNNPVQTPSGYGMHGHGVLGFAVDKGERWFGAWAVGAAKGYWREKFMWKGLGLDLWLGGLSTLGGAILSAVSGGKSILAQHMNRWGDVGVMSALNSLGAGWGAQQAGRVVSVSEPKGLPAKTPVVGWIPPAKGGDYLSDDEVRQYTGARRSPASP